MKQFLINLATNFLVNNGRVIKTKEEVAQEKVIGETELRKAEDKITVPQAVSFLKELGYTVYKRKK